MRTGAPSADCCVSPLPQADHQALLVAIRRLGRQDPDSPLVGDERDVDLLRFMTFELEGQRVPADMSLSRFTCRGYLNKLVRPRFRPVHPRPRVHVPPRAPFPGRSRASSGKSAGLCLTSRRKRWRGMSTTARCA